MCVGYCGVRHLCRYLVTKGAYASQLPPWYKHLPSTYFCGSYTAAFMIALRTRAVSFMHCQLDKAVPRVVIVMSIVQLSLLDDSAWWQDAQACSFM